jgi:hypothetical protein
MLAAVTASMSGVSSKAGTSMSSQAESNASDLDVTQRFSNDVNLFMLDDLYK